MSVGVFELGFEKIAAPVMLSSLHALSFLVAGLLVFTLLFPPLMRPTSCSDKPLLGAACMLINERPDLSICNVINSINMRMHERYQTLWLIERALADLFMLFGRPATLVFS